jgi:acyl carrier protein
MQADSSSAHATGVDREKVFQGVVGVVAEQVGVAASTIRPGDSLTDDLGCDSLDIVEISMLLEEEFDIVVPDTFGEELRTIAQVTDGVARLLAEQSPA